MTTTHLKPQGAGTLQDIRDRVPGSAPQSVQEILPIETALRQLDDRLRVWWNAKAVVQQKGRYDVMGRAVPPIYDGRWEVILLDDPHRTADWRGYSLVCRVTPPVEVLEGTTRVTALQADGPYHPVGWWLVDYLRSVDKANSDLAQTMSAKLDALFTHREQAALDAGRDEMAESAGKLWHGATKEGGGVSEFHPVKVTLGTSMAPNGAE